MAWVRWRLLGWMLGSAAAAAGRLLDSRVAWRRGSGLLIPAGRVFTLVSGIRTVPGGRVTVPGCRVFSVARWPGY